MLSDDAFSFVSHGCTGKGNDQVRFELAFYGLAPGIKVIAPWRLPGEICAAAKTFMLRHPLQNFTTVSLAERHFSPMLPRTVFLSRKLPQSHGQRVSCYAYRLIPLTSEDENLFHISYEAGILEDPNTTPPDDMWKLTTSPQQAPETPEQVVIHFDKGIPCKVTFPASSKTATDAVDIFLTLNALARKHGVGRIDIVENRFIGVKSRGCYESPAATILRAAHMDLEGMTLDRNVRALRDQFITTQFAQILYNGFFFSPEREFISASIPASQKTVNGFVRLKLYKGNVIVEGRDSDEGLYDARFSSMDEMGGFEPTATTGFIDISSIRIKAWARAK